MNKVMNGTHRQFLNKSKWAVLGFLVLFFIGITYLRTHGPLSRLSGLSGHAQIIANDIWPTYGHDAHRTGANPSGNVPGALTEIWRHESVLAPGSAGATVRTMVVGTDAVYARSLFLLEKISLNGT